jgi:hypothetical protein
MIVTKEKDKATTMHVMLEEGRNHYGIENDTYKGGKVYELPVKKAEELLELQDNHGQFYFCEVVIEADPEPEAKVTRVKAKKPKKQKKMSQSDVEAAKKEKGPAGKGEIEV